jgi:NAD(P)-dependent dehydrogenase (short-subunit alcohol dehydrogenase family)
MTEALKRDALLAGEGPVAAAVSRGLRSAGWNLVPDGPISGLIYVPPLFSIDDHVPAGSVVDILFDLVDHAEFRSRTDGGARVVVVGSRDGLGWPGRRDIAADSGALVAAARSLALQLGPDGITVNLVAAALDAVPEALTPDPVTAADIARTVEFFLDERSGYITGQVLYCCGGVSLLSSLSV